MDKLIIKKIETCCFFIKERMNMRSEVDEALREMSSSPLENFFSSVLSDKPIEFKETSKKLRQSLQAEGDMFLAYEASSSGKSGFVVTSKGVYAKSDGTRSFVDFETLAQCENFRFEDDELRADGKLLAVYKGSEAGEENLIEFFEELGAIIRGEYDEDDEEEDDEKEDDD